MSQSPKPVRTQPQPTTTSGAEITAGMVVSESAFKRVATATKGRIGVTLVQLDQNGVPVDAATRGTWTSGPAWSTMKVPLAMAVLAASDNPTNRTTISRAITASDNSAALSLWTDLGAGERAATAVEQQLNDRGDNSTSVQATVTRSGFSAFGQSQWSTQHQAWFAAHLVCAPRPRFILHQMQDITPSQQWGLGRMPGVAFKGGWGPLRSGSGYTARQFGVFQTADGSTWGVAIGSENQAGFNAAVADLNQIGEWLRRQFGLQQLGIRSDLTTRNCR